MDKITEWLSDQAWFQELKQKWDELDAQSRMYLQITGACASVGLVLFSLFSFMWRVHKLKNEVDVKSQLLLTITSANDELRHLREVNAALNIPPPGATPGGAPNPGAADQKPEPWPDYIGGAATRIGLDKSTFTISDPKPGTATDLTKESLLDVSLKKVNIKQVVRFALSVQNGGRPVKLRNLVIDTLPDGSGYLNATLSLSAFNVTKTQ